MRVIDGLTTHGTEFTRPLPPRPDATDMKVTETTQVWFSDELKLPLLVETTHSDQFHQTRRFTEIQRQFAADDSLFAVPDGYRIEDARPPRRR
jgi:outer membrane lipoprotein-sorting protein